MQNKRPESDFEVEGDARGGKRTPAETKAGTVGVVATAQRILLSDLTLPCRIGVTDQERAERQRLRFNIRLEVDTRVPREDRITEVVDYGKLVARIRDVCAQVEVRLVESLASEIAQACFLDRRVRAAQVRIEKLDRYPDVGGIGCEFEYRRVPGPEIPAGD